MTNQIASFMTNFVPQEAVRVAGEPLVAALNPHAPVQAVPGGQDGQRQDVSGQLAGGAPGLGLHPGRESGGQGHSGQAPIDST